ncbi:MAG TPA: hypothetical protein VF544_24960 [Pyrinomonadaceae bacterium]|jgi:hypothetical protein
MSTEHLQKASEIRRAAEQRVADIQLHTEPDDAARVKQIMEIRAWANEQIETQKRLHAQTRREARTRLLRRIFGLGFASGVTEGEKAMVRASYRDAIFRAQSAATPDEGQLFLDRANAIGDALLARAVALIAFERNWHDVLAAYLETHESARTALAELHALDRAQKREQQFLETVAFSQIAETAEERAARLARDGQDLAATEETPMPK